MRAGRSLIRNLTATFAWQGANYILPLITLPYLARVLGPAELGVLGFSNGVIAYFVLLTNWGFALSATQQIAANRNDPIALNEIFWNTLFAKAILGVFSLVLLVAAIVAVPGLRPYAAVLLLAWLQVAGSIITADWFLQGMERMGRFATAGILGKSVSAALIFLLVRDPSDVAAAAGLQGVAIIASGLISLRLAVGTGQIGRPAVSGRKTLRCIRDGRELFLSNAAISLYTNINVLALTATSGAMQVGLFVGADKIRNAVQGVITPISLVMYPKLSAMVPDDGARMLWMVKRLAVAQGCLMGALSIALWFAAPLAVRLLLGPGYDSAVPVLRWMAPIPFLVGLSNICGVQVMLPLGFRTEFLMTVSIPGILSLAYMPLLAIHRGAVGVSMALVLTEVSVNAVAIFLLSSRRTEIAQILKLDSTPAPV